MERNDWQCLCAKSMISVWIIFALERMADKLAEETGVFIDVETWQMEVPGLEIRRAGEDGRNINDKN